MSKWKNLTKAQKTARKKYTQEWKKRNPEKVKAAEDRRGKRYHQIKYGLTKEEFNKMIENQDGLCAICTEPMIPGKFTHVDHDHLTGKIRGILCSHCNQGLGYFKDNPQKLLSAIEYLRKDVSDDKKIKSERTSY